MSKIKLSYEDSIIYDSDFKLLDSGNWLNDRLISFVYEYLERETFKDSSVCSFVNPSTVQYLKLCENLQEAEACFMEPLGLKLKEVVFFPLNSNLDKNSAGIYLIFHKT